MSIFSRLTHYDRPGPGVDKDGPKKPRIVVFFEVFFRKFFNLCKLNLLFMIPVVAVIAIIYLLMNLLLEQDLIPYLIIGFALTAWLGMSMIGVAAVSVALAWIIYLLKRDQLSSASEPEEEEL